MKGIVVHYQGKVRRALKGRGGEGWLDVRVVTPVSSQHGESGFERVPRRPLCFVFSIGGRPFASSRNVMITKGRRYPGVEHWFVVAESAPHGELHEARTTLPASV